MTLHYCIMKVNDRCSDNVARTRSIMDSKGGVFIERRYFSYLERDPYQFLASKGVKIGNWTQHSHNGGQPIVGELGHLSATVDMLLELKSKNISHVVVFEDDCIIHEDFFDVALRAQKYDFDIFHFSYPQHQWSEWGAEAMIIDDFCVRADFKRGLLYASMYSSAGIHKILTILNRIGAVGATDLSFDEWGRQRFLDALCVNPENIPSLSTLNVESLIDPNNIRHS